MLVAKVKSKKHLLEYPLAILLLVVSFCLSVSYAVLDSGLWYPLDLYNHLLPASRALVMGGNPYDYGVYIPSYILLLVYPFTLLPLHLAGALWYVLGITVCLVVLYGHNIGKKATLLFFLSPPIVHTLAMGNLDWFPLLGLIVPPDCAAFFFLAKPQIGLGFQLALMLTGKLTWRGYILMALCIVSLLGGLRKSPEIIDVPWDISIKPWVWGILIGLILMWFSLSKNRILPLLESSVIGPLFSPYLSIGNLAGVAWALTSKPKLLAWASAIGWLILLGRLI